MTVQKILLVSHEMAPYTDISVQSDYLRDLAVNLQKNNAEIRVFMPKFGMIKERKHRLHEVIRLSGLNITVGRNNNPLIIKVASLQTAKIQVYFLDNDDFFHRKHYFKDDKGKDYPDNEDRTIFFNKGVLELLVKLGWIPDVIHCQGWMSSLVPLYAKTKFKNEPALKNVKLIYSHYKDTQNQQFGDDFIEKAHIDTEGNDLDFLKNPKTSDLYKAGAMYADKVLVSSEADASEKKFIEGLKKPVLDVQNYQDEELYEKYFKLING